MSSVTFVNHEVKNVLNKKQLLKKFITSIFINENKLLQLVTFVFCSDNYLLSLNKQFLKHDYYTDILTFDLSIDESISSEIYISIDRVKENSALHKVSFQHELLRVIFHGVLHLSGYSDKSALQKKVMTQKEDEYLDRFATFHVKP